MYNYDECCSYIESILNYIEKDLYRAPLPQHETWVRQMIGEQILIIPNKKIQHHPAFHDSRSSNNIRQCHLLSAMRAILLWDVYHCSYCLKHTSER